MSDFFLPQGTIVVLNLFRPLRGASQVSIVTFQAATPVGLSFLATQIRAARAQLIEGLPALLHPGVPVCVTVNVILADGDTHGFTASVQVERAVSREDVGDCVVAEVPALLHGIFEQMRRVLADKTPPTVQ